MMLLSFEALYFVRYRVQLSILDMHFVYILVMIYADKFTLFSHKMCEEQLTCVVTVKRDTYLTIQIAPIYCADK